MGNNTLMNREISWLSFNERVLQEAADNKVPLYERIKFLAIFSSNLDEFFRVRVASLRTLTDNKKKKKKSLDFEPHQLLKDIHETVVKHQEEFGRIYKDEIIPALHTNNIYIVDSDEISREQYDFLEDFFNGQLLPFVQPVLLARKGIATFLQNRSVYLSVRISKKPKPDQEVKKRRYRYAIVDIPSERFNRFIVLPERDGKKEIIFLDDVIKLFLPLLFPGYDVVDAYSIKLTRDAELYIDDEFSGDLLEKIKKNLSKRKTGVPCRFLYDKEMPDDFLKFLRDSLILKKEDVIPGGRYHNFHDFFSFPNPGISHLENEVLPPLRSNDFEGNTSYFETLDSKNALLYYPYHTYDHVIELLNEAASDSSVTTIKITLYRVASDSKVVKALVRAAENGKDVTAFVEVKARFDEESNIDSAESMTNAGVKVLYSFPGLKVHAKICLIERNDTDGSRAYAYLATGNFNEKTSRVYTDLGFMTSDTRYTSEVSRVFRFLQRESEYEVFKHLLVAPFNLREGLYQQIDNEISNAKAGKKAAIMLKLNNLECPKMIDKLYDASKAGVEITLILRGICCLKPGVPGLSDNIKAYSIVDRFLEHLRVFLFLNGGDEKVYVSSADLMRRNLNRRVEVCFPVYDEVIKKRIKEFLDIQLRDNCKARILDAAQTNQYRSSEDGAERRAQIETYLLVKSNYSPE